MIQSRNFAYRDLGGGRIEATIGLRPTHIDRGTGWRAIVNDFADGDVNYPHVVSGAPLLVYAAANGARRICPTYDPQVYFEIGAPYVKPAMTWQQVNLGAATRTKNKLTWSTTNADVNVWHGGHFVKLEIALKNGWQPPGGQFAFPVALSGLTRAGSQLLANGKPVLNLRAPVVYDALNPLDVRPIAFQFVRVAGQDFALFTLPSLAGMSQVIIDPTLELQPDATAGLDTQIMDTAPDTNYGTATYLTLGHYAVSNSIRRGLWKFDLTSIPLGSLVNSATLSLWLGVAGSTYASNSRTARVYRQKRAWTETGATWNQYDGANSWQTAGGFGLNDCEQSDIGTCAFATTDAAGSQHDFVLTAASVQAMIPGGSWMNNGFFAKMDTENADMYWTDPSDVATAATRPKLVVVYTVPSAAFVRVPGWGRW